MIGGEEEGCGEGHVELHLLARDRAVAAGGLIRLGGRGFTELATVKLKFRTVVEEVMLTRARRVHYRTENSGSVLRRCGHTGRRTFAGWLMRRPGTAGRFPNLAQRPPPNAANSMSPPTMINSMSWPLSVTMVIEQFSISMPTIPTLELALACGQTPGTAAKDLFDAQVLEARRDGRSGRRGDSEFPRIGRALPSLSFCRRLPRPATHGNRCAILRGSLRRNSRDRS
jgi:hypothetical protein